MDLAALGITPDVGIPAMIMGLRAIAALGLVGVPLNYFDPQAAGRDRRDGAARAIRSSPPMPIACMPSPGLLLALQLLSMAIAAIGR